MNKDSYLSLVASLKIACSKLKGSPRRMFLGQLALDLGHGGHSLVAKTMNVSRTTIRKGITEIKTGRPIKDKFHERGKKGLEETNPELIEAIRKIIDNSSQIDPKFTSQRLYTRLSAKAVRKQLIRQGYTNKELPCEQTIYNKMISLGYKPLLSGIAFAKPN